ncbi:MAG: hypothetical protein AAF761_09450, partial [Pseudomonadota bacterium]
MGQGLSWLVSWRYGAQTVARKFTLALCVGAAPLAATAEPVTIVAMGDSLTQGYGLFQDDGFVPQMERWLIA